MLASRMGLRQLDARVSTRLCMAHARLVQVVLEEGHKRKVIFSSFDPDCSTLLSLKSARYPVFFLTCAGSRTYADPRMNSLEAALVFAKSSKLQACGPCSHHVTLLSCPACTAWRWPQICASTGPITTLTPNFLLLGVFALCWMHALQCSKQPACSSVSHPVAGRGSLSLVAPQAGHAAHCESCGRPRVLWRRRRPACWHG